MEISKKLFGKTQAGDDVMEYTLTNEAGASVSILNLGESSEVSTYLIKTVSLKMLPLAMMMFKSMKLMMDILAL